MRLGRILLLACALLAVAGLWLSGDAAKAPTGTSAAPYSKVYLPLVMKPAKPSFGYGMDLAWDFNSQMAKDAGFGYVKYQLRWAAAEPSKGSYNWGAVNYPGNTASGLNVVLRVDSPPGWANGNGGDLRPPYNPRDYGDFMQALSAHFRGQVVAYEIWNEPNISLEWGGRSPNPAEYVALLKEAYRGVKAGDPAALVITAGLATTGGDGGATALDDVQFINRMYDNGAKGYFDALGSHPYGFSSSPETTPWGQGILFFRRAEAQHDVMVQRGDGDKQVWATEFGWLLNPSDVGANCSWPDRDWQKVSAATQADYLVRAYQYAYTNWSWMGVMLVFNLDFSDYRNVYLGYINACDPVRYYAVTNGYLDYSVNPAKFILSPRPAYNALKAMPKPTVR